MKYIFCENICLYITFFEQCIIIICTYVFECYKKPTYIYTTFMVTGYRYTQPAVIFGMLNILFN